MAKSLTYEFWVPVKNTTQLSTNSDRAIDGKFWVETPIQFTILPTERLVHMRFRGQESSGTMPELNLVFSGGMYMVLQNQVLDPFFYNWFYLIIYLFLL